jgi:UDP-N-acetylglucosamine--N-acetylmuramyl-(pentapeptide) pyrophosphoryl-undecaprenol N-acetylglucosamine transferase
VRQIVASIQAKATSNTVNNLVVGGSLGARVLNERLPEVFAQLTTQAKLSVRHQSGKGNHTSLLAEYQSQGLEASVEEFIHDMDAAYAWADLIICRAGALTVSEVAAAGRAALFVPLPHAVDDHQTANAQFLVGHQAALLMPQSEFTKQKVINLLTPYILTPAKLADLGMAAKAQAQFNATEQVADGCVELAG